MRRKLAFDAAKRAVDAGKRPAGRVGTACASEMEAARRVCDVAESLGRPNRDMDAIAQADWEMEKRLAYFPSAMIGLAERYDGGSPFSEADLEEMGQAFLKISGEPMPVSTRGESAVHRCDGLRPQRAASMWRSALRNRRASGRGATSPKNT